jgi:hypothetical protein
VKTERLDHDFPRPPVQNGRRPPSRGHVKSASSSNFYILINKKENVESLI